MNTNTLAAAVIGFLLGGLLVSTAAALEEDPAPANHSNSLHGPHAAVPEGTAWQRQANETSASPAGQSSSRASSPT